MNDNSDHLTPIKGHNNLFRDNNTGMVVSINNHTSEHYKRIREKKINERQEMDSLRSEVSEVKSLLNKLLEKING